MTNETPSKPGQKPKPTQPTEAQTRDARLKAALKANMGRRKQQARVRDAQKPDQKGQ